MIIDRGNNQTHKEHFNKDIMYNNAWHASSIYTVAGFRLVKKALEEKFPSAKVWVENCSTHGYYNLFVSFENHDDEMQFIFTQDALVVDLS